MEGGLKLHFLGFHKLVAQIGHTFHIDFAIGRPFCLLDLSILSSDPQNTFMIVLQFFETTSTKFNRTVKRTRLEASRKQKEMQLARFANRSLVLESFLCLGIWQNANREEAASDPA